MKPDKIPIDTLSINNEPKRPRILQQFFLSFLNNFFYYFLNA